MKSDKNKLEQGERHFPFAVSEKWVRIRHDSNGVKTSGFFFLLSLLQLPPTLSQVNFILREEKWIISRVKSKRIPYPSKGKTEWTLRKKNKKILQKKTAYVGLRITRVCIFGRAVRDEVPTPRWVSAGIRAASCCRSRSSAIRSQIHRDNKQK